jgi:hypothetical protein
LYGARSASADTIYAYKGKTYTSVYNDPLMDGEYTKSMRVTAQVVLEDPLDPNCICSFQFTGSYTNGLVSFLIFDGLQFHYGDGSGMAEFTLQTDSAGEIIGWNFWAFGEGDRAPFGLSDMGIAVSSTPLWGDITESGYEFCDNCDFDHAVQHGFESTRVGRWYVVPEPSSFALLSLGLIGLVAGKRLAQRVKLVDLGAPSAPIYVEM